MREMENPKRVQLTCPYCKHEFPFDNGWIDAEYEKEKKNFGELSREISALKKQSYYAQKKNEGKIKTLGLKIQESQMRCTALKKVRKLKDQQLEHYKYVIYRELVKEIVGEEKEKKIIEATLRELEAYQISGLMWNEFTIARYKKPVISISKL